MQRIFLIITFVGLSILTVLAVLNHGFIGIFKFQLQNFAGIQVFTDLFIALCFFLVWMWRDAKNSNRNPWPYIVITLIAGSFGPLFYLLLQKQNNSNS